MNPQYNNLVNYTKFWKKMNNYYYNKIYLNVFKDKRKYIYT